MAKGDIYYLRDKSDNRIVAKIEFTDDYCTGVCYEAWSWYDDGCPGDYHYSSEFFCKWDSCTHWWFKGEDYDKKSKIEHDSYYHLCGTNCFTDHIRAMCFVWKVSAMMLVEYHKDDKYVTAEIARNYFDDNTNNLIKIMLDGYVIEKEDNKNA